MKLASLVSFLVAAAAVAQVQQPPQPPIARQPAPIPTRVPDANVGKSQALPGNYILTLTSTEKDKPVSEMSFVVATPVFNMNPGDLTFAGTINPEEGGSFLIHYNIGMSVPVTVGNSTQYKSVGMGAAVRLRPGDSVQIYKSDERSYKLTLTPLPDQEKKK